MQPRRLRLTMRGWMVIVVAIALILTVAVRVLQREEKRRQAVFQARKNQLLTELEVNRIAEAEIKAIIEAERRQHPEKEQAILERGLATMEQLQADRKRLEQEISRLRL